MISNEMSSIILNKHNVKMYFCGEMLPSLRADWFEEVSGFSTNLHPSFRHKTTRRCLNRTCEVICAGSSQVDNMNDCISSRWMNELVVIEVNSYSVIASSSRVYLLFPMQSLFPQSILFIWGRTGDLTLNPLRVTQIHFARIISNKTKHESALTILKQLESFPLKFLFVFKVLNIF